jgi:hypothetical protein
MPQSVLAAQDHRPDPANPGGDMTPDQARTMLETTLREIVPDADGLRSVEAVTQFLVTRSDHVGQQA